MSCFDPGPVLTIVPSRFDPAPIDLEEGQSIRIEWEDGTFIELTPQMRGLVRLRSSWQLSIRPDCGNVIEVLTKDPSGVRHAVPLKRRDIMPDQIKYRCPDCFKLSAYPPGGYVTCPFCSHEFNIPEGGRKEHQFKCSDCMYWIQILSGAETFGPEGRAHIVNDGRGGLSFEGEAVGDCRRFPPVLVPGNRGHIIFTRFPRTGENNCCGEWKED